MYLIIIQNELLLITTTTYWEKKTHRIVSSFSLQDILHIIIFILCLCIYMNLRVVDLQDQRWWSINTFLPVVILEWFSTFSVVGCYEQCFDLIYSHNLLANPILLLELNSEHLYNYSRQYRMRWSLVQLSRVLD